MEVWFYVPYPDITNAWDKSLPVKKRDVYGWDKNPLVWVVSFRRMDEREYSEEE